MAQILPIAAGKGKEALTGDIFTRSTNKVVGKGKKAVVVDSTLHINPVAVAVGAGALIVSSAVALYALQLRLVPTLKQKQKWVVDTPAVKGVWVVDTPERQGIGTKEIYHPATAAYAWTDDNNVLHRVPAQPEWYEYVEVPVTFAETGHKEADQPEVGHWENDGDPVKRFSIEQRRAFSMGDILDSLKPDIGSIGKELGFKPVFGDWSKGKVFSGKWW